MKKHVILFVIGFVLISFFSVRASDLKGRFALSGQGGVSIPVGDFADEKRFDAEIGSGVGGAAEYFVSNSFAFGGTVRYTVNDRYKKVIYAPDLTAGQKYKMINFGAFVKYVFPTQSNLMPYVRLDLGFYKHSFCDDYGEVETSVSFPAKFGFGGGGGLMYRANDHVSVSTGLLFHNAFTEGATAYTSYRAYTVVHDIQFITVYGGITILIGGC